MEELTEQSCWMGLVGLRMNLKVSIYTCTALCSSRALKTAQLAGLNLAKLYSGIKE